MPARHHAAARRGARTAVQLDARLPTVAIVGRPNVGKSALFNRILGERLAVVHQQSGVTRDRIEQVAEWGRSRFRLVDTAGLLDAASAGSAAGLAEAVRKQALAAIGLADLLILVVDVQTGITPLDEAVAELLRRSGKRVLLAVNKVDEMLHEPAALEFHALGLDPLCPVSALHGLGVAELLDEVVSRLGAEAGIPEAADAVEPALPVQVAVVGRPNVGKSSLVNALLDKPRVVVDAAPGTTRDAIDVPLVIERDGVPRRYLLIDTAGLRHTTKIDEPVEYYSTRRSGQSIQRADLVVIVIDAAAGPTRQDQRIGRLVADAHRGCILALNKSDLVADDVQRRDLDREVAAQLGFLGYAPRLHLSALTGDNVEALLDQIDRVAGELEREVPTAELNRVLAAALARYTPPLAWTGGQSRSSTGRYRQRPRQPKLFYASQVGIRPPRFRLFVNDARGFGPHYRLYLERQLRQAFGFAGAPIGLQLRSRQAPD